MANPKGYTVLVALAAIAYGLATGACGSPSKSNANAGVSAPGINHEDCMRAHGVPNFPDPGAVEWAVRPDDVAIAVRSGQPPGGAGRDQP